MTTIEEGKKCPAFKATATNETAIASKNFKDSITVLYFYPRDNTPGCTQQGIDFGEHIKAFDKAGAQIIGVSRDTLAKHEKFKAKFEFPFELIADPEESLCELFGVMVDKNMYGKKVRGIERSTFVIGPDGKFIQIWRKVKVPGHVEEVLNVVRELA